MNPWTFSEQVNISIPILLLKVAVMHTTFRFSYSNLSNSSILPKNELDRNSFALRATQKVGKQILLDVSLNYANSKSTNPQRNGGNENPLFAFTYYRPRHVDINYYTKNFIDPNGGYRGNSVTSNSRPLCVFKNRVSVCLKTIARKRKIIS